ncbi:CBS domain-containing protein [Candidatus Woesearchaeota archaeon]|nr:CBS domain-containing protein [Candidatus Woesearchaeota archaeon]
MVDKIKISKFMTKDVITASPEITVQKAAKIMADNGIGVIVITKNNKIAGIITERDIVSKVVAKGVDLKKALVKDYMITRVVTGTPDMTDVDVALTFSKKNIKKLPIVDNGKVVGIITQTDMLKELSFKWAI